MAETEREVSVATRKLTAQLPRAKLTLEASYSPAAESELLSSWNKRLATLPATAELNLLLKQTSPSTHFLGASDWNKRDFPKDTLAIAHEGAIYLHRDTLSQLWKNLRELKPSSTPKQHSELFAALSFPLYAHELEHLKHDRDLTQQFGQRFPFERLQESELLAYLKQAAVGLELNSKQHGIGPSFYEAGFALAAKQKDSLVASLLFPLYAAQHAFTGGEAVENIERAVSMLNSPGFPIGTSMPKLLTEFAKNAKEVGSIHSKLAEELALQEALLRSRERVRSLYSWTPDSMFQEPKEKLDAAIKALTGKQNDTRTRLQLAEKALLDWQAGSTILAKKENADFLITYSALQRQAFRKTFDSLMR